MGNWEQPLGLVRVGPHALLEVCPSAVGSDCRSKYNILLRSFGVPSFPEKRILHVFSMICASPTRAQNSKLLSQRRGHKIENENKEHPQLGSCSHATGTVPAIFLTANGWYTHGPDGPSAQTGKNNRANWTWEGLVPDSCGPGRAYEFCVPSTRYAN